jgi:opacity protein-like surface antigen
MERWRKALACVAMCATMGSAAFTARADDSPTFEFTPFVGGRFGGGFDPAEQAEPKTTGSADIGAGASYGLDLGLYRDEHGFYELLYSHQDTSLSSSDPALDNLDVSIDYLQVGGTAFFEQDSKVLPYVSLTIGAARFEPKRAGYDSDTKFAGTFGVGLRYPFTDHLAATFGLRGYVTFLSSNTSLFCASGPTNSSCLVRSSGSVLVQGEGQLGLTFRF